MQHIEERDVTGKIRDRGLDILKPKLDVAIMVGCNPGAVTNLARIDVEAEDRLRAGALAQIKREQSDSASDIENRFGGKSEKLVGRRKNPIAPQFAAHVMAEPLRRKLGRDPRTRVFVFRYVSFQGFHLRRVIALPD